MVGKAYAARHLKGDEKKQWRQKRNRFFNHSVNVITSNGLIYCIWQTKEGITAEAFQEFIDGPTEPGFGLKSLMNIYKPIDVSLMNGQTPYPRLFS